MYSAYFTLKILRSSPRRHRGERTTTIPMKTPPLPVGFAVDGCFILCSFGESVPAVGRFAAKKIPPAAAPSREGPAAGGLCIACLILIRIIDGAASAAGGALRCSPSA